MSRIDSRTDKTPKNNYSVLLMLEFIIPGSAWFTFNIVVADSRAMSLLAYPNFVQDTNKS